MDLIPEWHYKLQDLNQYDVEIRIKGVRQSCILSPIRFNVDSEIIFESALEADVAGIVVNGKSISNIRYAVNSVIIVDNSVDLKRMIQKVSWRYPEVYSNDKAKSRPNFITNR